MEKSQKLRHTSIQLELTEHCISMGKRPGGKEFVITGGQRLLISLEPDGGGVACAHGHTLVLVDEDAVLLHGDLLLQ